MCKNPCICVLTSHHLKGVKWVFAFSRERKNEASLLLSVVFCCVHVCVFQKLPLKMVKGDSHSHIAVLFILPVVRMDFYTYQHFSLILSNILRFYQLCTWICKVRSAAGEDRCWPFGGGWKWFDNKPPLNRGTAAIPLFVPLSWERHYPLYYFEVVVCYDASAKVLCVVIVMLFIIIFQYARAVDTYSLFVHCGVQGWYIFSECFSWCAQVTIVCTCLRVYAHTLQKCDSWAFAYNDTAPMRWWICPTRKINCLLPVLNTYVYAHCLICSVLFLGDVYVLTAFVCVLWWCVLCVYLRVCVHKT